MTKVIDEPAADGTGEGPYRSVRDDGSLQSVRDSTRYPERMTDGARVGIVLAVRMVFVLAVTTNNIFAVPFIGRIMAGWLLGSAGGMTVGAISMRRMAMTGRLAIDHNFAIKIAPTGAHRGRHTTVSTMMMTVATGDMQPARRMPEGSYQAQCANEKGSKQKNHRDAKGTERVSVGPTKDVN